MITGLVYPTPGAYGMVDGPFLARARDETGLEWLRVNLDCRSERVDALVETAQEMNWRVWPILDLNYEAVRLAGDGDVLMAVLAPYLAFCVRVITAWHFPYVEILNEPSILGKLSPLTYAQLVNAVGRALADHAPDTQIIVAGEMLRADRRGPKTKSWWAEARAQIYPTLFDGVAVHPYREPGPPSACRWRDRDDEHRWITGQSAWEGQQKAVHVTEVGWSLRDGIDEIKQAAYLVEELSIQARVGAASCFVYAHHSPDGEGFGLYGSADRPRPAVAAIRAWTEAQR